MQKSSKPPSLTRIIGFALAAGIALLTGCVQQKVRLLDQQMSRAYKSYQRDSFEVATNVLSKYIRFLEAQPPAVYRSRDVSRLSYIAHANLAYMLLCSGDAEGAGVNLNRAYAYHKKLVNKAQMDPVTRTEFVDYIIKGVEKVDAKAGAAWKAAYAVDTNTVERVKRRFLQGVSRGGPPLAQTERGDSP